MYSYICNWWIRPCAYQPDDTKQLVRVHHHNASFTCKNIDNWERGLALKVVLVYAMKAHESV